MRKEGKLLEVKIFTDGACSENPGPGGWAAVFNTDRECKVLKGHEVCTTNNRMELTAVVRSMEKILKSGSRKNNYKIFSDSAYVVNSINNMSIDKWRINGWKTTRGEEVKNRDLWERFINARIGIRFKGLIVDIIKVKGHSGNVFNEYVDKLAKQEVMKAKSQWRQ